MDQLPVEKLVATDTQQQVEINTLHEMHGENTAKIEENTVKIDAVSGWAAFIKTPIGIAVSGLLVTMIGAATVGITKWMTTGNIPIGPIPVEVTNWPETPKPVEPVIIVKERRKVILYVTAADSAAAKELTDTVKDVDVTVDPTINSAGATYLFRGKNVPLPCGALLDASGKVVDVQPFAGVPAMLGKK